MATKEDDPDRDKNAKYLQARLEKAQRFISEMVFDRQPGDNHYNPMNSYIPSGMTADNRAVCNILVAMNELRIASASFKYARAEHDDIDDVKLFGAHVLEWLAPDRDGIASPWK